VTDNRAFLPSDFDRFSITAPADSRLPNSGNYPIADLYNVRADKFGQQDNFFTSADNYGHRSEAWNGVEVNFTARVRNGLTLQGGTSTGRTTTDSCEIRAQVPEMLVNNVSAALNPYCHVEPPFKTQVKGLASYLVPKIEVQVSAAFQSLPGNSLAANYTSAPTITAGLGRAPTGAINTLAVNLVAPGEVYGDRINQIDLRIGKLVRFAGLRSQFSVDIYNALNSSAKQPNGYNQAFIPNGNWLVPTAILPARFAKLTAQIDF
jgi:hypothetical protein